MEISTLIKKFEFELRGNRFRENSIENYISCAKIFLEHFKNKDSIRHINESEIKTFLYSFNGHNTQRSYHSAIKSLYKHVAKQPNKFRFIKYCKKSNRLPIVLSMEEMHRLIVAAENLKHKTIICLMYSTAIRVGEVINLKISDIDSSRMVINIIDAKGGKDRQVTLDKNMLFLLREYYIQYRPKEYLFNGQFSLRYSERSIAQFLNKYSSKANLNKRVYPHLIRHTAATHLVEAGTDMSLIQRILGHSNIKTTHLYAHISNNLISKIQTPLTILSNKINNNSKQPGRIA